ncbi:MAG TPA: EAL domain-containing protein [Thermoanaerobaculia bacterium]|jgi:EAL domain-containing protein (putative c-di-GMP-specific phosphodiesterase class I)|nr:EAL domain-containing protein [Thermoanaerobaculia bacterium]
MTESASSSGVRRALDQHQLVLFYQPIHELESRRIVSAEALLRSKRESGEIRSAVPLTEAAEESPDIFRLDSWTMHRAYADAASWQTSAGPDVHLNVNLSPREFQEGNFMPRLLKLVGGNKNDLSKINLEITEMSYIEHPKQTMHVLDELKELGVQLWLDDFGTGHSSIEHLLHFPLDGVKVPGTFVSRLSSTQRARSITKAIIDLAHELEMKVIAEEIEHRDQLEFLREMGCEYIQGFLFSKPMPLEEFVRALDHQKPSTTETQRSQR